MNLLKSVRNFAMANVLAVFPLLWAVLGWMPDQVKVRMRGWEEAPGSIMAKGVALAGEEYGEWSGGRVFRFYLRAGMEWKDLVFRFPGASGIDAVERVELQKWKLLSLGKRGNGLTERGPGTTEYVFPNPRFDLVGVAGGKVAWALAALELLLAVLSWWCARRHQEESWKKLLPPAIAVVLALTLLTQVALPIQSYWANRASYPFSFGALAVAVSGRFAWMSALGIVAVTLLSRCFGRWVFGMVFALAVCIYLESGILSNGLANLNGDVFLLQDRTRAMWDAAVWTTVFAGVLAVHPFLRKRYVLASLCLMLMVGASMFDTKHENLADKSKLIVHDFVPIDTVIRNVTYSTNRNVMVFILDSLEREQAHAIMEDPEAGPKLREQFRGFTEYTNNVGALPQTLIAVPNLLTGRYPDGTESIADYAWSCYGQESALRDFLEIGYDVFVTTPGLGCGFATRTSGATARTEMGCSVLGRSGNGGDVWSVRNFTRWRYMPFAAKASVSSLTVLANGFEEPREWGLYPELDQATTSPDCRGTFLLVHTEGVHVPIRWNRFGEMLSQLDDSEEACLEMGVFIMGKLGDLMDSFRDKGVYDNSLIVVLGDHGEHKNRKFLQDKMNGCLPRNARPCLWVKPVGSTHGFISCEVPSGHAQMADLLKVAARKELSEENIKDILQADQRIYRRMALPGNRWTQWTVNRDGSFIVAEGQKSFSTGDTANPLQCGYKYPLLVRRMEKLHVDFAFQNMDNDGYPCLLRDTHAASIELRVPDISRQYVLRMELYDTEGGSLRFRSDTPGAEWEEFPVRPHGEIVVHNVAADASGIARVLFERAAGPDIDVAFTSLMLEAEK